MYVIRKFANKRRFLHFAKQISIHFFSVLAIFAASEQNKAIFSSWLTFATIVQAFEILNIFDAHNKITS